MTKKFNIEVHKHGEIGADDEHVVRVEITEGTRKIGEFHLPGGTCENARGIGQGLKDLVDTGFDLTTLMQDSTTVVDG